MDENNANPNPETQTPETTASSETPALEGYDLSKPEDRDLLVRRAKLGEMGDKRLAEITAERERLESLKQYAEAGRRLAEFKQANPSGARAVSQAVRALETGEVTPQELLAALKGERIESDASDVDEGHGASHGDPRVAEILSTMNARYEALESELRGFRQSAQAKETQSEIDRALASDEVLKSKPKFKDYAAGRARELMSKGLTFEEAMTSATLEAREMLSEAATTRLDQRRAGAEMRSVSPSMGTPAAPKVTGAYKPQLRDDMKPQERVRAGLNHVMEIARERARAAMRGIAAGPQ